MLKEFQVCANCLNAKVVQWESRKEKRSALKVKCAKDRWPKRGILNFGGIGEVTPPVAPCPDYDSMGDEVEEYLETLPSDSRDVRLLEGLSKKTGGTYA